MTRYIIILALFIMALTPRQSRAIDTSLQLFSPNQVSIEFDPFTGMPGLQGLELDFILPDGESRAVNIIITPDITADFQFDDADTPLDLIIDSNNGQQSAGRFETRFILQPAQSNLFNITFRIPAQQYANAGTHTLNLLIQVEDEISGEILISDRLLRLDCNVPLRAETNFAGTTPGFDNGIGIATLDFGPINFGDTRQVQFQIRGNADVIIEMTSENKGYIVNRDNAAISPIPYSIDADGVMSDMSTPLSFTRRPEKSLAGSRYPLKVTLNEPEGGAFAGQYHDVISIDVTPQ